MAPSTPSVSIIMKSDFSGLLTFNRNGVFLTSLDGSSSTLIQSANFTSAIRTTAEDIFGVTSDGHVWSGGTDGSIWEDLGGLLPSINGIVYNNNRFILDCGQFYYSDDNCSTFIPSQTLAGTTIPNTLIAVDNITLLTQRNGNIWKSIDNGENWEEILNNPQQGQSQITCLIKI